MSRAAYFRELNQSLRLSDRERIMMCALRYTGPFSGYDGLSHRPLSESDKRRPYWSNDVKIGDLVICQTSRTMHNWMVGFVEKHGPEDLASPYCLAKRLGKRPDEPWGCNLIREPGTENVCHMVGETFLAVRSLPPAGYLEGEQFRFYVKVLKAFASVPDDYGMSDPRFAGITFPDRHSRTAYVGIRTGISTVPKVFREGWEWRQRPQVFKVEFTKRTSIKSIVSAIVDRFDLDEVPGSFEHSRSHGLGDFPVEVPRKAVDSVLTRIRLDPGVSPLIH